MREALMWSMEKGHSVKCNLCAHRCVIPPGKTGICGVRKNESGKLMATTYAKVSSVGPDPIEKKPLNHFLPGTTVLSLGSIGCNFRCDFCQNWSISQEYTTRGLRDIQPEELPRMAAGYNCKSISWTYNEPTIWFEYTLDGAKMAKANGLGTSYVTNGFITEEALREIAPYLDAMNIDVKAFTEEFYYRRSKAKLQPVLDTCELAIELGIHIEITYLIIPGQNDDPKELRNFASWAAEKLGTNIPIHFSRFHPDYNFRLAKSTPMETLRLAYRTAKEAGLKFIYLGNVAHCEEENTHCPECGHMEMERYGLRLVNNRTKEGKCSQCGADLNLVLAVK